MSKKITKVVKALIKDSKELAIYELSNNHLYELFEKYPKHVNAKEIVAKVLILGRTYAAAIERGRGSKGTMTNDEFYSNEVPKTFKGLRLDKKLQAIYRIETLEKAAESCLKAHWSLMKDIRDIAGKDKRSFCSKYLHFHLPNHFFIYDSRAASGLTYLKTILGHKRKQLTSDTKLEDQMDAVYYRFFTTSLLVKKHIEEIKKTELTLREFDSLLIAASIQKIKSKK
jgi:hypothetical protein